jgi:hypothetical protein
MTFRPNMLHSRNLRFGIATVAALGLLVAIPATAQAATAPVPLGTADSFVVLAGAGITNTGATTLNGDVGTSPAPAMTGFSSVVLNGAKHAADSVAAKAQTDLTNAYTTAANAGPNSAVGVELAGKTLQPGVYKGGALGLNGTLTLDGGNNPDAVFIFKAASTLITGANSHVKLVNVNPCNVFWQVTSSATLGTGSKFVGTIMALTDVHLKTGAVVDGRALARNGAVTLEANTITKSRCQATGGSTPSAKPGAPTGVSAVAGNTEATVSWTAGSNGGSSITRYEVTATPGGKTATTTGATHAIVKGLTNGTAYTFTVTATNTKGVSVASEASTAVTPSATPGAQVKQVPTGAVRTGDGSTSGGSTQGLLAGALLLAGVGGASIVAARRRRVNN